MGQRVTGSDRWTALEAIQSKRKIWTALASSSFFPQFLSYFLSTMSSSSSLSSSLSPSSSFSKQLPAASFVHPALLHWWRVFLSLTTTTRMLLIGGLTQNYFLFVLPRLWWQLLSPAPNNKANSDEVRFKQRPDLCTKKSQKPKANFSFDI